MPRRKQDRPKRMKYSEDGKEEECDAGAGTEEEEEDDDLQDDCDGDSDERSEDAKASEDNTSSAETSTAEPTVTSPATPPPSPTPPKSTDNVLVKAPVKVPVSVSPAPKDNTKGRLSPTPATLPVKALPLSSLMSSSLPLPPSLPSLSIERTNQLLPVEPLEELEIRPLSSLENMSKAIEQKIPSVFEKYQGPRVKETVKLPYKPSKVIKEMPSRSQHSSMSSASHKTKDRIGSSKGQCVPPSMTRHTAQTTSRSSYPASSKPTPTKSGAYVDTDQPLDLSKKTKPDSDHKPSNNKSMKSQYQFTPLPPSNSNSGGSGSSLSNLEKRFGGNSFLFDGTSGKLNIPKNPLYQAFGGNLFATALYNTPPLASTDQVYRPHYRNYWPGPIPAPRHTSKPHSTTSSTLNSKSHHHENNKISSSESQSASRKDSEHPAGIGALPVPSTNGKYTNLICSCKNEFETLYDLTIHMQSTGHTPLPCKNGDQGEYPKLVRGQDMWLNQGMEQTRQILRCMQCGESFKSLPELTIHMMKTRHYTNIVGAESRKIHKYTSYYSDNEEDEGGSVFCCKVCHESFKDMDGLANHMVVSGHHKKHMLKNSTHGSSSSGGTGGEVRGTHPSHYSPLRNHHDSNSQSPKPAGIPVAPTNLAHSYRNLKSPTATVATLLESHRTLTNGSNVNKLNNQHTPDRKRKHSSSSSNHAEDWKNKLIKMEKNDDSPLSRFTESTDHHAEPEDLVKDYRKTSVDSSRNLSEIMNDVFDEKSSKREVTIAPIDSPVIKSEKPDSDHDPIDDIDQDDDDSMRDDGMPELNNIRCENCGERIATPNFVEHVRVCVKLTPEEPRSPKGSTGATHEDPVLNLKSYSHPESPKEKKLNEYPHPLEYIPYKKRSRYEEAAMKAKEQERPSSLDALRLTPYSPRKHSTDWSSTKSDNPIGLDMSKVKKEKGSCILDTGISMPYPERPRSQDVNIHRVITEPKRPRSEGSERYTSAEPLRSWSADKFDILGQRDYPKRPHSSEDQLQPKQKELTSKPNEAILDRPFPGKSKTRDISPESSPLRPQWSPGRSSLQERLPPNSLSPLHSKSPVLHSTTGPMVPALSESSGSSALKAMENFIERSFITNSNKPNFYRSHPMNGRMACHSMGGVSRLDCPLPDSTGQHVEAYSAQHKYLPPSLPTNMKIEKPESQKESSSYQHLSQKVKVEGESDDSAVAASAPKSNGKSDDTEMSDTDAAGTSSSPKQLHQKYLADGGSPEGEKSSSALQSLQGLVYGKSFSTEHPLDSLQKLIHNTNTPTSIARSNGLQQTYVTGMATLQQQGMPSTVILVNPIVTVMPTSSSASSTVHINISRDSSPPMTGQCSPTSSTPTKSSPLNSAGAAMSTDITSEGTDQSGDFRCQACNRTFASKGSYRYHLSRCHLSSVKRYGIKEAFNMSPYVYLPLDHTAKFNEYCEMANELANKGK